jgi:hypothetical protein
MNAYFAYFAHVFIFLTLLASAVTRYNAVTRISGRKDLSS